MEFSSKPLEEHQEVPLADDGRLEALVNHYQYREGTGHPKEGAHSSYVVSVALRKESYSVQRQEEILGLVRAQGDCVVGQEIYRLAAPDARALFRSGAAKDISLRASECGADLLVIDALLSPSQTRNLEDATGLAVRDREAVILNVFQRNVRTRKARIQVEIAHLEYLRPRIRGLGLEMDQQAGGIVGSRGPGETASELLARQLDGRLAILRRAFQKVAQESEVRRKRRSVCRKIALVGYTNAGKTSLMNRLTASDLSAANRPFETLDTTSRCLSRHGGDVLLSDTVGFIRDLPERLFESFSSTLAEIHEASLLALVVDISDPEAVLQLRTTQTMLLKLGAAGLPRFYIFTKLDRLFRTPPAAQLRALSHGHPHMALGSDDLLAVAMLRSALLKAVQRGQERCEIFVPYEASEATSLVYANCRVVNAKASELGMLFCVETDSHHIVEIRDACRRLRA